MWRLQLRRPLEQVEARLADRLSPSALEALRAVAARRATDDLLIVSSEGRGDARLGAYLASRRFVALAPSTRSRYARSLVVWLNFLGARGRAWDDALPDDVGDFMHWRLTDRSNPSRVGGSAAHADLAAVAALYEWASPRFGLQNPVLRKEDASFRSANRKSGRTRGARPEAAPAGVRDRNVKWLDPAAVERWINLGLLGLNGDGEEAMRTRIRTGGRDAAYASLLYGSGLRRTEGASLLLLELPEGLELGRQFWTQRMAGACAKGHRGRQWWLPRTALREVLAYRDSDRAAAVSRARLRGAYEGSAWLTIEKVTSTRRVTLRSANGGHETATLDEIDPLMRLRLLSDRGDGPEPEMLWLNENGLPRPAHSWNATFATGNKRVGRLGMPWFLCTPHMLRHSFALRWYSVGRLLWDTRLAHLTLEEQSDFRSQFGDTWTLVQTLLGHADPQTTADIYLEPFKGLETQLLLQYARDVPVSGLLEKVLSADPRILRDPYGGTT